MALNLIIGDASGGKSNILCKRVVEESLKAPSARFITITPEQATMLMQKRIIGIHPAGVISNIDIVSFNFLAYMIFEEAGKVPQDVLDDTGKSLVLKKVLKNIQNDLCVYKTKANTPGFVNEAKSIITELKQYDIDDNDLFLMQEAAEENGNRLLYSKLSDIRLILKHFDEEIEDKYSTSEEIPDIFAKLVPQSEIIKDSKIYLDGFTGFTPIQYKLIEKFLENASDVTVAFTLPEEYINEDCKEHELFYLSNQTYKKLSELAEKHGTKINVDICKKNKKEFPDEVTAQIYEANTVEEEITFTAKNILELVKNNGYRFKDIAVITADMDSYHRQIKKIYDEAQIAHFIDHKNTIIDNMMSRFVLSAGKIIEDRFSYDSVFSYLKTGLTGIERDEISRFENYCLEFGIKGPHAFLSDFYKNKQKKGYDLEKLNEIRKKFTDSIIDFYKEITNCKKNSIDYCDAYIRLFEKNEIKEKMKNLAKGFSDKNERERGMEYEQIYEEIEELFLKIKKITGDEPLEFKDYLEMINEGLCEIKVGIIPPSLDAVIVGDLTRTRIDNVKALFFIGASEENIPKKTSGDLIFSKKEREFLKDNEFDIAPSITENIFIQRFYVYLCLKKANENVYISYTSMSADGEEILPSYMITDADTIIPGMKIITNPDVPSQSWESDGITFLANSINEPDAALLNYFAHEKNEKLKQILNAAFFSNRENDLDKDVAKKIYGDVLVGSVSRYEQFAECPYKHFLKYGLNISKRPEYEVEATAIGTIYHDCLERYSKKIEEEGYKFSDITDEASDRIVKECVDEVSNESENEILNSSARNEFLLRRIYDVSRKTVNVLREHIKCGKYEPEFFERNFQSNIENGTKFSGKIDRIDIYDGENVFVKVIDYKSGSKKFDITDVYSGKQLQLVAYMKEAVDIVKEKNKDKDVRPGGIYYYLINDKFTKDEDEALDKNKMSGITNSDPEAIAAIDGSVSPENPGKSHIANFKFSSGKLSSSDIASSDEFENMLSFVEDKLKDISESIKNGDIKINPLYKNQTDNACGYCDYKDVCKFDDNVPGADWNRTPEETVKEEAARKVMGRIED